MILPTKCIYLLVIVDSNDLVYIKKIKYFITYNFYTLKNIIYLFKQDI